MIYLILPYRLLARFWGELSEVAEIRMVISLVGRPYEAAAEMVDLAEDASQLDLAAGMP